MNLKANCFDLLILNLMLGLKPLSELAIMCGFKLRFSFFAP